MQQMKNQNVHSTLFHINNNKNDKDSVPNNSSQGPEEIK